MRTRNASGCGVVVVVYHRFQDFGLVDKRPVVAQDAFVEVVRDVRWGRHGGGEEDDGC
jgi:hypothetical protein